jgi:hypothetical protein
VLFPSQRQHARNKTLADQKKNFSQKKGRTLAQNHLILSQAKFSDMPTSSNGFNGLRL